MSTSTVFALVLGLVAAALSLVATGLSLLLAGVFWGSHVQSDRSAGVAIAVIGLLWTVGPALLSMWVWQARYETATLLVLLGWGGMSVLLFWFLANGIEAAARP